MKRLIGAALAVVCAAAAVSAPVDLHAAGNALEHGFNMVYTKNFLSTMKRSSLARLAMHPRLFDAQRMLATRTLREFDDLVTAPLHGFRGVDDYYTRQEAAIEAALETLPGAVTAEFPETGGHAGFISGAFPGSLDWLPQRLLGFFAPA